MNALIILFLGLMVFCLGYYIFAVSYAGIASSFLWFWGLAGTGFFILAIVTILHKKKHILDFVPRTVKITVVSFLCIGVGIFIAMEGFIFSQMQAKPKGHVDYVIILGAQVRGERITKSLAKRLDAAYDYLAKNEDIQVICSGGQGPGERITEASAMKRYLMDQGISQDRIITEEHSTSTYENMKYSFEIIGDPNADVVIVTNNFHVFRSLYLAKNVGFKSVSGLAANSDRRLILNYMVREGFALLKEFGVRLLH